MADVSRATAGTSAREAFASRDYFYVGGRYVEDGTGNHVFAGQMYVEHLLPLKVTQSYPIVFIHGGGQTGSVSPGLIYHQFSDRYRLPRIEALMVTCFIELVE